MSHIVDVRAEVLRTPLHTPFVTALRRTEHLETVLVRITDDAGRVGWGDAPQVWQVTGDSLRSGLACLNPSVDERRLSRVTERGLGPAHFGDKADRLAPDVAQSVVARNYGIKAAVDEALWDVAAQEAELSLAAALAVSAGRSANVPLAISTDVTVSAGEPDELAQVARERVAAGFITLKLKVGTDASADVARIAAVRAAVGSSIGIRVDANQGWSREESVKIIRALGDADLDIEFVEQPIAGEDVEGLAWIRERVELPLMADETCYSRYDLERIIALGAADLVNIKLAKCGSLTAGAVMLERAQAAGLGTIVGSMMESAVGVGAASALVAAMGTTQVSDLDAAWWTAQSPFGPQAPRYAGGEIVLTDGPGAGITLL